MSDSVDPSSGTYIDPGSILTAQQLSDIGTGNFLMTIRIPSDVGGMLIEMGFGLIVALGGGVAGIGGAILSIGFANVGGGAETGYELRTSTESFMDSVYFSTNEDTDLSGVGGFLTLKRIGTTYSFSTGDASTFNAFDENASALISGNTFDPLPVSRFPP